ncbi:hypothetical protein [Pseudomonas sp. GV047]|uniref:hypothetical protein n=1 Tax=Pseudomonas sp. GV047 TaxID=2135751 RepID=UPI000D3AEEEA|nr:hypothetical protein [Pseudomonas sp. GV047]PUB40066.1 hypothetical protein C8K58_11452 [Pseudomonas sp. GV047]
MKERFKKTARGLGRGFKFLYKKYGFVRCVIGLTLAIGACNVIYHMPPSNTGTHESVAPWSYDYQKARASLPACGPEVGPYDYHGKCTYTEKSVRQTLRVGADQCPVLIADAMGVDADSLKAGKIDYSQGAPRYTFTLKGEGFTTVYTCTENMGDVMAKWDVTYKGEKTTHSNWHNMNTESF